MNISEILTDIGIDAEMAKKGEKAVNREISVKFIAKDQYNKKVLELDDAKKALKEAMANGTEAEAYKTKVSELETKIGELEKAHKEALKFKDKEFDEYKADVDAEKVVAAKQTALRKHLLDDKANPKLSALLEKEFDLAKIELEGDKIKDWEAISKPVKEQYADLFTVEQQKFFEPAKGTPDAGGIKNPWLKENRNLAEQTRIYKENPQLAVQLAKAAGKKLN